jgi:hypothetical protein
MDCSMFQIVSVVATVMDSNGNTLSCPDMQFAVPCGDGHCHSDYISCLRVSANILFEFLLHAWCILYVSMRVSQIQNKFVVHSITQ